MAKLINVIEDTLNVLDMFSGVEDSRDRPTATRPQARRPKASQPQNIRIREARKQEFTVVDSIDAVTGRPSYIVRNARGDTAECSSLEFAQRVQASLG